MEKDDIRAVIWSILCVALPFITLYGLALYWWLVFMTK